MRPRGCHKFGFVICAILMLNVTGLVAQRSLTADGQTAAYPRIQGVLHAAPETPDCSHPAFGPHITQATDDDVNFNKYVFVFNMHVSPDNDRCSAFDRQRLEIKTEGNSSTPAYLKGFLGDTVTFRWDFKLDAAFQPSTAFTHIHQIKAFDGDDSNPIITLTPRRASPNRLELIHINSSGVTTKLATTPLAPFLGQWVEAYEKITYGHNGQYSIVLTSVDDGTQLFSFASSNLDLWRTGTTVVRPKWGIYRSLNDAVHLRDEEVRFDRFCLAKGTDDCLSDKDSPEFSLAAAPSSITTGNGGSASLQVDATAWRGLTGDVALSVTGLPPGATAQFTPSSISGGTGSATLKISTTPDTSAGQYPLIIEGVDGLLSHVATVPLTVSIDSTPPETTASVSPGPNGSGWNNADPTVTLSATDGASADSGVQQITYSANGAQTIAQTVVPGASASLSISAEGTTIVTFFATDNAGNVESPKTMVVKLDKTPPAISGSRAPAANAFGWNNTNVTVAFQCADNLSGMAAGSPPDPIVVAGEGSNQTVAATCVDLAGNTASASVSGINIDKTSPIASCSADPNVIWPPNHKLVPVSISVNVSDPLSGPAGFTLLSAVSNEPDSGNGDIQALIGGASATSGYVRAERLGSGSGRVYSFTYKGLDRAGNSSSCTTSVTVPHDQGH
jgi:hypothetical protein